jgi:membrane fusion protein (multidrug efflux system)
MGQNVRLHVAAYPDTEFNGIIDLISPVVDEATRNVQVRALVPNPNALLRPGMFARVETLLDVKENAPVIPESALVASLDGFSVYLVENDTARLAPVEIGIRHRGKAEIRKGLSEGQLIVITGTQKLVDGTAVVAAKPESAPATPATTP